MKRGSVKTEFGWVSTRIGVSEGVGKAMQHAEGSSGSHSAADQMWESSKIHSFLSVQKASLALNTATSRPR